MKRKTILSIFAITGVFALSSTPLWSQDIPEIIQKEKEPSSPQQPATMQKQTGLNQEASRGSEMSPDKVKKVQEALKEKGHDPGPIDGILGPQTREALKAFQMANDLKATGQLDEETASKLGVEDSPSAKEGSVPQ